MEIPITCVEAVRVLKSVLLRQLFDSPEDLRQLATRYRSVRDVNIPCDLAHGAECLFSALPDLCALFLCLADPDFGDAGQFGDRFNLLDHGIHLDLGAI